MSADTNIKEGQAPLPGPPSPIWKSRAFIAAAGGLAATMLFLFTCCSGVGIWYAMSSREVSIVGRWEAIGVPKEFNATYQFNGDGTGILRMENVLTASFKYRAANSPTPSITFDSVTPLHWHGVLKEGENLPGSKQTTMSGRKYHLKHENGQVLFTPADQAEQPFMLRRLK